MPAAASEEVRRCRFLEEAGSVGRRAGRPLARRWRRPRGSAALRAARGWAGRP